MRSSIRYIVTKALTFLDNSRPGSLADAVRMNIYLNNTTNPYLRDLLYLPVDA